MRKDMKKYGNVIIVLFLWGIYFTTTYLSIKIIENIKYKFETSTVKKYYDIYNSRENGRIFTKSEIILYNSPIVIFNELRELHTKFVDMELFSILYKVDIKNIILHTKGQGQEYINKENVNRLLLPPLPSSSLQTLFTRQVMDDDEDENPLLFSYNQYIFQEVYAEITNPTSFNPIYGLYWKMRNKFIYIKRGFERIKKEVEYDYADIKMEIVEGINEIWRAYTFFIFYSSFFLYTIHTTIAVLG
jgi:hypothetical protein